MRTPFLRNLAGAGVLRSKRATTHWAHTDLLQSRYPSVTVDPDVLYIDDGDVLTSAGKAAARFDRPLMLRHIGATLPSLPHIEMTIETLAGRGVTVTSPSTGEWVVAPGPIAGAEIDITGRFERPVYSLVATPPAEAGS
mgnify:CR=1 FL=1